MFEIFLSAVFFLTSFRLWFWLAHCEDCDPVVMLLLFLGVMSSFVYGIDFGLHAFLG